MALGQRISQPVTDIIETLLYNRLSSIIMPSMLLPWTTLTLSAMPATTGNTAETLLSH